MPTTAAQKWFFERPGWMIRRDTEAFEKLRDRLHAVPPHPKTTHQSPVDPYADVQERLREGKRLLMPFKPGTYVTEQGATFTVHGPAFISRSGL